jgi:hypothetical protein
MREMAMAMVRGAGLEVGEVSVFQMFSVELAGPSVELTILPVL